MKCLNIASWNVNSVNIRKLDILEFMQSYNIDIMLLQEIKCENSNFPSEIFLNSNYYIEIHGQKAYNGVAIISKYPLFNIIKNFDDEFAKLESRYIQASVEINNRIYTFASIYVPNGTSVGHEKYYKKINFFDNLFKYIYNFRNDNYCIGGDFNVAPFDIDVYSPIKMQNTLSFTEIEKQKFRSILNSGFSDTFRILHPDIQKFSWWDYRSKSLENNTGLRIDMILTSSSFTNKLHYTNLYKKYRHQEKPSDHIPIFASFYV